jgi:RNA polymerase sigma-70 factor (ECF subfamily)
LAQWLYTVCRNRALDICRKEKRMKSLSIAEADSQPSRETSQESAAQQRDSYALVQRLLSHFPAHQQEVVRLKFQDGLSYREISSITALSVSNVGYLIHTAIQKVRQELGEAT